MLNILFFSYFCARISIYYEEIDNKRVMIVAGNQHKQ